MNPLAYLLISLQLTSVMLAVVFLIAWLNFGRRRHALLWSLAFLVAAVQWLLNLTSQKLPVSYDTYWQIVNLTSILTVSLAVAGHRLRVGLPNRLGWYFGGGITVAAAIAWFTFGSPHVGLRTAIGPLYAALMLLLCIRAILLRPRQALIAEWSMAAVTAIFAACETAAAIAVLSGGAEGTPTSRALYQAINFLSLPAAYTGMGLFTVLILASDMSKDMRVLALTDSLTGVLNLRGFDEAAARAIATARRTGTPLCAIACDLDHFKSINDRFGHSVGDEALRRFASHLRARLREEDIIGRIGGEEFMLLLPRTSLQDAAETAERLRAELPMLPGGTGTGGTGTSEILLQASFGVATLGDAGDDIVRLKHRADAALYTAKRGGRNRVSIGTLAPT
jgi:diguanylate cyclase (GGDEF)-like protein